MSRLGTSGGKRILISGPDLSKAHLYGAHLYRANLSDANLNRAYLSDANCIGANLFQADLSGADLRRAKLGGADLGGASLGLSNLSGANLSEANLSEAFVVDTTFANVDLSAVKGIETVRHVGPSTIGIDTVYRSQGNIPEIFLRGAGVGDDFISVIKAHAGSIQFYSASSATRATTRNLPNISMPICRPRGCAVGMRPRT